MTKPPAIDLISVAGLGAVPETLLIPLAARAIARTAFPRLGFADPAAEAIAARLDTDLTRFSRNRGSMHASILRAQWFDEVAKGFFRQHPKGLCISLGSGLDTRAQRIGIDACETASWIDLDLADVVALRIALIPDRERIRSAMGDLAEPSAWIDTAPWEEGRPLLVLVEGVIMYLPVESVNALVRALCVAAAARGAVTQLALDYASPLMVRLSRRHPSVGKTRAVFASSLRRPTDLCALDQHLRLLDHRDISAGAGIVGATIGRLHWLWTGGRRVHGCALYRFDPALSVRPATAR